MSIQIWGSGVDVQLHWKACIGWTTVFSVSGLTERVIASDGLLEDYNFSTEMTRNPYLVDFMDTDGVVEIQFDESSRVVIICYNEGWVLNGAAVQQEIIEPLTSHLADFARSRLEWNEQMEFNASR